MKLLIIGTDASLFEPGSSVAERIGRYARLFDGLDIVVMCSPGRAALTLPGGARVYPTNSSIPIIRVMDAVRLGSAISRASGITHVSSQDPAESGLAARVVASRFNLPLQLQVHTDILAPQFRNHSLRNRIRARIARALLPRAANVRVVSVRVARSVESLGVPRERIRTLPIFVDREGFARATPSFNLGERYPEFGFVILMVSRLTKEKNIPLALEAFARHRATFPDSGLVIVGDGPERSAIERCGARLGLGGSVRLEGWQDDLASYYKTADLYLLTSDFEGYGRTVIEAAASGLPVVMTDVGVARETIREHETGIVVPVGDAFALGVALNEARQHPDAPALMARRAQQEVMAREPRTLEDYLVRYRETFS